MSLPANLIFLVFLGFASPLLAQRINDNGKPQITSTIISGWEDSAAIAFLVLLAVIVISVPCVVILIRIRRKNRKIRRLASRGTTKTSTTAGGRSYEEDYELGLRQDQGVSMAKEKEGWTLKEIEVIMRGGAIPNGPPGFNTSERATPEYRPATSASAQPRQQAVALQPIGNTTTAKTVGIGRAQSVKMTKVKPVTVIKTGRVGGGDGSTIGGASVASSPRRPETALTRSV